MLTRLAQFSLAREPHTDKIETPKAAVSMAKKTSFVVVVVVALLTIYARWCKPARRKRYSVSAGGMPKSGIPLSFQRTSFSRVWRFGSYSGRLNFGVIPRVIHQHIFPFRRLRKAVVTRAVLTIFVAGNDTGRADLCQFAGCRGSAFRSIHNNPMQ